MQIVGGMRVLTLIAAAHLRSLSVDLRCNHGLDSFDFSIPLKEDIFFSWGRLPSWRSSRSRPEVSDR